MWRNEGKLSLNFAGPETTRKPTTTPISSTTTEEICHKNLDDYGPIDVTRSVDPESVLDGNGGWIPQTPSKRKDPYSGSPLRLTFSNPVELTSLLVESDKQGNGKAKLILKIKPPGSDDFEPVINSKGDPIIFKGNFGDDILLPEGIRPADDVLLYPLEPLYTYPLYVTPFGCVHPGEYSLRYI